MNMSNDNQLDPENVIIIYELVDELDNRYTRQNPAMVRCPVCGHKAAFKIVKNSAYMVHEKGVRNSDKYRCIECGVPLYEAVGYIPYHDLWVTTKHYPNLVDDISDKKFIWL